MLSRKRGQSTPTTREKERYIFSGGRRAPSKKGGKGPDREGRINEPLETVYLTTILRKGI